MNNQDTQKDWAEAYDEARKSHAAGEPMVRTVCKIATRFLFVLLAVGVAVGILTGCKPGTPVEQGSDLRVYKDEGRGVTCWVIRGNSALSCIADSQLKVQP